MDANQGDAMNPQPKPKTMRSEDYIEFVRDRACCSCGRRSPSDPHHAGRGGKGIKAPDDSCIPLCRECHRALERNHGKFKGWSKAWLREWQDGHIEATQAAFIASLPPCDKCRDPFDFSDVDAEKFWDDGLLLCGRCRRPDKDGPDPEWDKENHLESVRSQR